MSHKPDRPVVLGPSAIPIHDLVMFDALDSDYRALASLMADRGRLWVRQHGEPLHPLTEDDPMVAAVHHLADALARLQQGVRERSPRAPRADQHYQAVLLIAGHMAREVPLSTFRRPPTPPGRAA